MLPVPAYQESFQQSTNGKCWKQARIYRHIIEAAVANKYRVAFGNNPTLECFEAVEENVVKEEQRDSQENPDPEGQMPGQLSAASEAVQPDYHSRKRAAIAKKRACWKGSHHQVWKRTDLLNYGIRT